MNGHADLIPLLATKNANLDQLSKMQYRENALHLAARNGHTAVIEALLKAGADINALEGSHSTALMYAAYYGRIDVVKILLEHGADTTIQDQGGHIAAYWAKTRGFTEIAQLIETSK
jgi:ankyrin repeat protein